MQEPGELVREINRAEGRASSPSSRPSAVGVLRLGLEGGPGGGLLRILLVKNDTLPFTRGRHAGLGRRIALPVTRSMSPDLRSQPCALDQTNSQWPRVLTTRYK